jgi:hypothetical protein
MAGYTDERIPQMQRRMLDAAAAIPGVTAVGYTDHLPLAWAAATRMFTPTARPISGPPMRPRTP